LYNDISAVDQVSLPEREKTPQPSTSGGQANQMEIDTPIRDDGFGGNIGEDITGAFCILIYPLIYLLPS